jgi:S1-C subfamily serine protease
LFFSDSVCFAQVGERKGLINSNGEYIVDLETTIGGILQFKNDVAVFITNNGKQGVISKSGEIILPAIYKDILRDGDNGFIVMDTLENMGYINNQGDFIIPCKYDAVHQFSEELTMVTTSRKCGYVDTTGTWVIDSIYDDARDFGNGLARVKRNEEWMFIDHNGKEVGKFNFDEILTGFTCNRAFIKKDNRIELIDKNGKKIANIDADSVYGYHNGYATFKINGKYGKLDSTGVVAIPPKYENLFRTEKGLSIFTKNKKQGIIDSTGQVIIEAKHDIVHNDNHLTLLLCIDGDRATYYDRNGKQIWKDMQGTNIVWPERPTKNDYIRYFDSRLSELDPIEGIYYVTFTQMAVDRNNDHATSNGSKSRFYAIIRKPNTDVFTATLIDEKETQQYWVKKFVQIGETNSYAVVNYDEKSTWAEDGKLILEDPYKFEVTLRQGGNNYYNWYCKCEFIKDYPSTDIYEQVQKAEWTGTGFAIADGYIATNYHVTNGAKTIKIRGVNGDMEELYRGYLVASDRNHDLAIIKIVDKRFDRFDDIPYCLGKSVPEVGNDIFVLGYPMTETMGKEIKLTGGIISAASGYKGDKSMYQISAAVQPGNSGGPLFDNDGNVIGIVCAKHSDAENANYAIKVSYLLSLINSTDLGAKLPKSNNVDSKSISKIVKQVQPFVYMIECSTH